PGRLAGVVVSKAEDRRTGLVHLGKLFVGRRAKLAAAAAQIGQESLPFGQKGRKGGVRRGGGFGGVFRRGGGRGVARIVPVKGFTVRSQQHTGQAFVFNAFAQVLAQCIGFEPGQRRELGDGAHPVPRGVQRCTQPLVEPIVVHADAPHGRKAGRHRRKTGHQDREDDVFLPADGERV